MALFSFRRKAIVLKKEASYGTDASPSPATDGILAMNLEISLTGEKLEREIDRAFFTANPFVLVGRKCEVTFDFEPLGANPGGVAAPCGPLLEVCAHAQVLDAVGPPLQAAYNPISDDVESGTINFWMGDQLFEIVGVRGTIDFEYAIKTFGKGKAKLTGQFALPSVDTIGAVTLTAWQDPPAIETETWAVTVDGDTVNANSFTLMQANEVPMIEGSDSREVVLTDRKSNGVLRIFDPGVGVLDFWSMARNHDRVPIVSTVNGGTGRLVRLTVGEAQFEMPKFVDIEGARGLEIPYHAVASDAGSDEYLLEFE